METINSLLSSGLVVGNFGDVPVTPNIGIAVWARKLPKPVFTIFPKLAGLLTPIPLHVFVDDVCTMAVTSRSVHEQEIMNDSYQEFFTKLGCKVYFSSNLYRDEGVLETIFPVASKVGVKEFYRCLPEEKRRSIDALSMDEAGHTLLELALLERVREYCDAVFIGEFSQAIIATHRNVSPKPLSAIVVPKIDDLDEFEFRLESIKTG